MKFGMVGRNKESIFRYQGWPTVCRDENGTLYVVSSGHRLGHICPFGKNLMYVSRDEGEHWSFPTIVNDTALDNRDGGILSLGNGKLLMSYFSLPREFFYDQTRWLECCKDETLRPMALALVDGWRRMEGEAVRAGSFVRLSDDNGKTWGEAIQVPVTAPHGPIRLRNGKLLYVGTGFQWQGYEENQNYALESADGGQSWVLLSKLPPLETKDAYLCEPHAVELENGRILVALRYEHPLGNYIYLSYSDDGGRHFTDPKPTGIFGVPPHLLLHSSGALILTYARRKDPCGQRAVISYDGGETFSKEIVIGAKISDWDLGYPSTVELSDGSLFTVYYQKCPGDDYASVLSTKWELPK